MLTLVGIFIGVRGGFKKLAEIDERFVISRRGTDIMLIGLVIGITSSVLFATGPAPGVGAIAVLLAVVAMIISLIGSILTFIVGLFRLDGRYGDKGYVTVAVFYIIGIFIPSLHYSHIHAVQNPRLHDKSPICMIAVVPAGVC